MTKYEIANLILSSLALSISIFRDWLKSKLVRSRVETYVTGKIEIGFSNFGPTIGIIGTLRAINNDSFITNMKLIIKRVKDSATYNFEWLASRPLKIFPNASEYEIAYSFLLQKNIAKQFSIFFSDTSTRQEMDQYILNSIKSLDRIRQKYDTEPLAHMLQYNYQVGKETFEKIKQEYKTDNDEIEAFSKLSKINYWKEGQYNLMLIINNSSGKSFIKDWTFDLSKEDEKLLDFNIINILELPLDNLIGAPPRQFSFANASYK